MAEHLQVFDDPSSLADAAKLILTNPELDIVVTKGFAGRTNGAMYSDEGALYAAIPELHDVNDVVAEWWEQHGPKGFCIDKAMSTWFGVWTPIEPHLDPPLSPRSNDPVQKWQGPITGTIMHKLGGNTKSVFNAQNPNVPFDPSKYSDWETDYSSAYMQALHEAQGEASEHQGLRTSYEQARGDILLFRNFPSPTMHGTEITGGLPNEVNRMAQIITGFVAKAPTEIPVQ